MTILIFRMHEAPKEASLCWQPCKITLQDWGNQRGAVKHDELISWTSNEKWRVCLIFKLIFLLIYHFCSYELNPTDYQAVRATYKELQEHTLGLCKGGNSLPVLAVELQNSCHLLQANMMIHDFELTYYIFF